MTFVVFVSQSVSQLSQWFVFILSIILCLPQIVVRDIIYNKMSQLCVPLMGGD